MGTLVCVSELKPAFIFLPSASPLRSSHVYETA